MVAVPLKRYPLRIIGSTTLISVTGLRRRLAMVCEEVISAKTRCSSSQAVVVPFGERLGVPSGHTVAIKPKRCSRTTRFMSSVNRPICFSSFRTEAQTHYPLWQVEVARGHGKLRLDDLLR